MKALKAWREQQARENREQHVKPSGYVFTDVDGGPLHPDFISRAFRTHIRRAGVPDIRFHDLRHDFASRLAMKGVDLNSIRELLGHSTIAMTLRYSHLMPGKLAEVVAKLGG